MEEMKFLFTPEGFIPDITDDSPVEIKNEAFAWKGEGAYNKLYEFGAGPRPEHLTPSASYLYTVSSSFFKALTELPELEVAREKAKVKLSQEQMDYLLDAVPFGLGAENITAQWIKNIYKRFQKHYKEEIKAYPGTVEMYLSEKNQDLHVPERIFFHLVEVRVILLMGLHPFCCKIGKMLVKVDDRHFHSLCASFSSSRSCSVVKKYLLWQKWQTSSAP